MTSYIWNAGNGNWDDAADWAPQGVPDSADQAYFTRTGAAYDVTTSSAEVGLLDVGSAAATVEVNGQFVAGVVDLTAGAITVDEYSDLETGEIVLSGGALNINGGVSDATIIEDGGAVNFSAECVLDDVTFDGTFNLTASLGYPIEVGGPFVVNDASGKKPGVINISGDDQINFTSDEVLDNATVNLGDASTGTFGALAEGGSGITPILLTLGDSLVVNSYGGFDLIFDGDGDSSSIINDGIINQLNPLGQLEIGIHSGTFSNDGLLQSRSGGQIVFVGDNFRNAGILTLANGSTFTSDVDSFINNAAGRITIGAGSGWTLSDDDATTQTLESIGQIVLTGGVISAETEGFTLDNTSYGTISGFGEISFSMIDNDGLIEASGGALILAAPVTGAGTLEVDAHASASLQLSSSQSALVQAGSSTVTVASKATLTLNGASSLGGLINGAGALDLGPGATATLGAGANLASGGGTVNAGTLSLGGASITAPVSAAITHLNNSGVLNVTGSASKQALLQLRSAAGFGTAGMVTGEVTLAGDSAISFTSGSIREIGSGDVLQLGAADAYLEDASATGANSALTDLNSIAGIFNLSGGATVTTTKALTVSGSIHLDGIGAGAGGSRLTVGAALTNTGIITIGNSSLTKASVLTATSLTNSDAIQVNGDAGGSGALEISGHVLNNGTIALEDAKEELAGTIAGTGAFDVDAGSKLTFDSSVAAGLTVDFGEADTLTLKTASAFHATIANFGTGDAIDATTIAKSAAHFNFVENGSNSGGTLTLTSGGQSAHWLFSGSYDNADFSLSADSGTGTLVKFV